MNLFFLNIDPKQCAQEHCDKHVVKMVLEIVQMLYTAHHLNGNGNGLPEFAYKLSHAKHPISIWIRECFENWNYAINVAKYLSEEYTYRYNKIHSCQKHIEWLLLNTPKFKKGNYKVDQTFSYNKEFESMGMTPVPLAMPDECKRIDNFSTKNDNFSTKNDNFSLKNDNFSLKNGTIISYRNYYIMKKRKFARWTSRIIPRWYTSINLRKIFN